MSYLQPKQPDSVWIIEDNSIPYTSSDDVRDYFYPTRAAAVEAFWMEFGQINVEAVFKELKRVGNSTPPNEPTVRTVNVYNPGQTWA